MLLSEWVDSEQVRLHVGFYAVRQQIAQCLPLDTEIHSSVFEAITHEDQRVERLVFFLLTEKCLVEGSVTYEYEGNRATRSHLFTKAIPLSQVLELRHRSVIHPRDEERNGDVVYTIRFASQEQELSFPPGWCVDAYKQNHYRQFALTLNARVVTAQG